MRESDQSGNGHPGREAVASSLTLFLNSLRRYPLLTAAEEVELAKRVEQGDRVARDRMITSNLRLVVSIAKSYKIPERSQLTLLDLIQEGAIGLTRAVELFDWRRGNRFSTYASYWIRQSISRCLREKSSVIRLPTRAQDQLRALARAEADFRARNGRDPGETELARLVGLSVDRLFDLRQRVDTVSLDEPVGEDSAPLGASIGTTTDIAEDLATQILERDVRLAVAELPARLKEVVILRFGMGGEEPHSLAEIGVRFGVTRERVRQLERKALEALERNGAIRSRGLPTRRSLRDRVGGFDGGALLGALKAALAGSVQPQLATGVAVIASAGAVAPVALMPRDFQIPHLLPKREVASVTSPAAQPGTEAHASVAVSSQTPALDLARRVSIEHADNASDAPGRRVRVVIRVPPEPSDPAPEPPAPAVPPPPTPLDTGPGTPPAAEPPAAAAPAGPPELPVAPAVSLAPSANAQPPARPAEEAAPEPAPPPAESASEPPAPAPDAAAPAAPATDASCLLPSTTPETPAPDGAALPASGSLSASGADPVAPPPDPAASQANGTPSPPGELTDPPVGTVTDPGGEPAPATDLVTLTEPAPAADPAAEPAPPGDPAAAEPVPPAATNDPAGCPAATPAPAAEQVPPDPPDPPTEEGTAPNEGGGAPAGADPEAGGEAGTPAPAGEPVAPLDPPESAARPAEDASAQPVAPLDPTESTARPAEDKSAEPVVASEPLTEAEAVAATEPKACGPAAEAAPSGA